MTRREFLRTLAAGDAGQDTVEYALLLGMVSLGGYVGVRRVGREVDDVFGAVARRLMGNRRGGRGGRGGGNGRGGQR